MFKLLKGVSLDGGPAGQAFGGGIYNVSCDMATSNEPTKISFGIVSENGAYGISSSDLMSPHPARMK